MTRAMPFSSTRPTAGNTIEIRAHLWAAWAALAAVPLAATWADPDLGGHLRYGLDILRDWRLPADDPYSFTQNRPWVNHEWLSEVVMAGAYALLGAPGLILLKAALTIATLAILQRRLRGVSPLAAVAVLTLALLCALSVIFTVRPQLWSMRRWCGSCRSSPARRRRPSGEYSRLPRCSRRGQTCMAGGS